MPNIILYSLLTGEVKVIGKLQNPRYGHQAFLLNESYLIVYGGHKISGNYYKDITEGDHSFENTIELINVKTGFSNIIGKTHFPTGYWDDIVHLGGTRYLIVNEAWGQGKVHTEVLDLAHPKQTTLIEAPVPSTKWGFLMEGTGECKAVMTDRVICVGSALAREINTKEHTSKILDELSVKPITFDKTFNIPKVGFLVFGISRDFLSKNLVIQRFDTERYAKDLAIKEGKE